MTRNRQKIETLNFTVTILGNNSAIPAHGRHPTAQVVHLNDQLLLVDCGEGTQMQINAYKVKSSRINHIFISHLHGDHYFGLIGLLNSFGLLGRNHPLHLYAPAPLEKILNLQLEAANNRLPYDWIFHPLREGQTGILFQNEGIEVSTFPTDHKIECHGFIFKERHTKRKILPDEVRQYDIPYSYYSKLKEGADFITEEGEKIPNHRLTAPPDKAHQYAYCADTKYDERIIPFIEHSDLIYHESTYLAADKDKAEKRYHSTAAQAATIAKKSKARHLLLGHFSSRYLDLEPFLKEAQVVFEATTVSREGTAYYVKKG